MGQDNQEAYENYLRVVDETSPNQKKEKAYVQLNIRIKKTDKAKLDKIVAHAKASLKVQFELDGEHIELHEIHEPSKAITAHAIVRHWVLKKINELVPNETDFDLRQEEINHPEETVYGRAFIKNLDD